jgi:hypothetical protein
MHNTEEGPEIYFIPGAGSVPFGEDTDKNSFLFVFLGGAGKVQGQGKNVPPKPRVPLNPALNLRVGAD